LATGGLASGGQDAGGLPRWKTSATGAFCDGTAAPGGADGIIEREKTVNVAQDQGA
jgi:hypothetical protein